MTTDRYKQQEKSEYDRARRKRLLADPSYRAKIAAQRQSPEYKAKEQKWNRKKYPKHKAAIIARTKAVRATEEGRTNRNTYEKNKRANETAQQRKTRLQKNALISKLRRLTDKQFVEKQRANSRKHMRELRQDQNYKAKNKSYQKEWSKKKRARKRLDAEYDSFMEKIATEEIFDAVNKIIDRRSKT